MQSPVCWALLGLVIERSSYAYELAQRFDRAYDGVLALSSVSHAYKALATLESRSLIEEVPGTRTGRQPRPRYRATAEGVASYQEWLVSQVGEDRRRQQLVVLQLAALTRNPEMALGLLDRYEQACLTEASRIPVAAQGPAPVDRGAELLSRLVAEESRLAIGAKLAWLAYARRELTAIARTRRP